MKGQKSPQKTAYLATAEKPTVYGGWAVEILGLKLVTHHPVIEAVSARRRERNFPQRQACKSRLTVRKFRLEGFSSSVEAGLPFRAPALMVCVKHRTDKYLEAP
jgi:hypothetical protein